MITIFLSLDRFPLSPCLPIARRQAARISFMNTIRSLRGGIRLLAIISFSATIFSEAQIATDKNAGRLKFEKSVTRGDLLGVNSVEMSADGRFVYATPWQNGALVVFERNVR